MDTPIIDKNMKVCLGNCIRVSNVEKKNRLESSVYVCIQVESEDGKSEYAILLTQGEYDKIIKADTFDMKDMVPGRIYAKFILSKNYYTVRLKGYDGVEFVGLFEIGDWRKYYERALKHPNSCTKKSFLADILD
jgi:hypothetical protein